MAAPRAYWKGYLKLSLVTCPVALYPASANLKKRASIRSIAKRAIAFVSRWSMKKRAAW